MEERLQKIIARAGVASRRHAEQLIISGQVKVNGKTVRVTIGKHGTFTAEQARKKAQKYLVETQKPDGSWEAKSRAAFSKDPGKINPITIHWGTSWATIGLVKTMGK